MFGCYELRLRTGANGGSRGGNLRSGGPFRSRLMRCRRCRFAPGRAHGLLGAPAAGERCGTANGLIFRGGDPAACDGSLRRCAAICRLRPLRGDGACRRSSPRRDGSSPVQCRRPLPAAGPRRGRYRPTRLPAWSGLRCRAGLRSRSGLRGRAGLGSRPRFCGGTVFRSRAGLRCRSGFRACAGFHRASRGLRRLRLTAAGRGADGLCYHSSESRSLLC